MAVFAWLGGFAGLAVHVAFRLCGCGIWVGAVASQPQQVLTTCVFNVFCSTKSCCLQQLVLSTLLRAAWVYVYGCMFTKAMCLLKQS